MNKKCGIFLIILISNAFALWSADVNTYFNLLKNQNFEEARSYAGEMNNEKIKSSLIYLTELLMLQDSEEKFTFIDDNDELQYQFIKRLILGYQYTFASKQENLKAFIEFSEALKISDEIENKALTKAALIAILDLFSTEIFIGSKQYLPYLERFGELKEDTSDEALEILFNLIFHSKESTPSGLDTQYYNIVAKLDSVFNKISKSHSLYPRYYYEKGIQYKGTNYDKASVFFVKADSLASTKSYLKSFRGAVAWQLASVNTWHNNLDNAKKYLQISKRLSVKLRETFYNDRLASLIFQKENNYDSAYYYLRKSVDIEYQLGYKNNTLESSILSVQNQTDKLKLDKLELDAQSRKNRNWATALGLLLVLGGAIAFLVHSNTKRKQLLAEQEKTLQEQKVVTLLKEQELTTIDAMIEGQEKERQRIANDLHDDLGGLMATVKLHFNALHSKVKDDTDEMYEKTNLLLDEAYQKIRAIAHAKNSGVIAKQGLLKAIEQMAEKVSAANGISIEVKDFGLDNRLENSLELTLFRIVQELIANIIKHANATKANVHLTNHGDTLNILVEDNGIGFHTDKTLANSVGMGLKSIDKRVAHLEGTLHIESEPGKGATVIIDIPL